MVSEAFESVFQQLRGCKTPLIILNRRVFPWKCCDRFGQVRCVVKECEKCVFAIVWLSPILQSLHYVCFADLCCCVFDTKWRRRTCWFCDLCFGGGGTCASSGDDWAMLSGGTLSKTRYKTVQGLDFVSFQLYSTGWLGWFGWWQLQLSITVSIRVVLF